MKTEYKDGKVSFRVEDLFDLMPDEDKISLIEVLSCQSSVIKHVTSQILDSWTENGYYGPTLVTASANPIEGLDWAFREVARRSGEVAAKEIKRLENALEHANKELQELRDEQYRMRSSRYG